MVPLPGAGAGAGAGKVDSLDMSPDITRLPLSLDTMDTLARAQERVTGVYTALVDSGLGDLYNRVLCPTCIVQILIINTMVVSGAVCRYIYVISIISTFLLSLSSSTFQFIGKMIFWGLTSSMPASLPFLGVLG